MIPEEVLGNVVDRRRLLTANLFGSRFWGDYRKDSDYDVFLLVSDGINKVIDLDYSPSNYQQQIGEFEFKVSDVRFVTKQVLKGNVNYIEMLTSKRLIVNRALLPLIDEYIKLATEVPNPSSILKSFKGIIKGSMKSSEGQTEKGKDKSRYRKAVRYAHWLIYLANNPTSDNLNATNIAQKWNDVVNLVKNIVKPTLPDNIEVVWYALDNIENISLPLIPEKREEFKELYRVLKKISML